MRQQIEYFDSLVGQISQFEKTSPVALTAFVFDVSWGDMLYTNQHIDCREF